jgi:nucleoside-diphosphate-sugar epimerase
MQKILITGPSGFIGSYLINTIKKTLRIKRDKIYTIGKTIQPCFKHKYIIQYSCNLRNKKNLKKIIQKIRPDIIIHLAATIYGSQRNLFLDNIAATENLLECLEKAKIKQFIFMSSCAVYDRIKITKKADEKYALHPSSYYGKTKIVGENLLEKYAARFHFNYTIFRLHMAYGKGDKNISYLFQLINRFRIAPVISKGYYFVQPIYVEDVITAIQKSIGNRIAYNKTYNLAGPHPILFRDLISLIIKKIHKKILIIPLSLSFATFTVKILEFLSTLIHKKIVFNDAMVKRIILNSAYDITKIQKDLNLHILPIEKGIQKLT